MIFQSASSGKKVYFVKTLSIVLMFTLVGCEKKIPKNTQFDEPKIPASSSAEREKFSPYFPSRSRQWMGYQEALNSPKFGRIIEVSKYHQGETQTSLEKNRADEFYLRTVESLKRWDDVNVALAEGYVRDESQDFTHYANANFLFDGETLNPDKPEYLMFYDTPKGIKLVGAMFIVESLTGHGDQFGGLETVWHFHDYGEGVCAPIQVPKDLRDKYGISKGHCDQGYLVKRSTEMIHVWIIDHPEGRYATSMTIDVSLL